MDGEVVNEGEALVKGKAPSLADPTLNSSLIVHIAGMVMLSLGVYSLLRSVFN